MRVVIKFLSKCLSLNVFMLIVSAQLCGQEIAPGIAQVPKTKSWTDTVSSTASSLGSTLGGWLSSGASTAGHYLGKIVPQAWQDAATKIISSGTKTGQDAFNYIANLTANSPSLTGQALKATQDKLISLQKLATNLLESAIQANEQLAAKGGVSPAYQRAAAIALLSAESAATAFGLYKAIGLINGALAAAKDERLSHLAFIKARKEAEKELGEAITGLSTFKPGFMADAWANPSWRSTEVKQSYYPELLAEYFKQSWKKLDSIM